MRRERLNAATAQGEMSYCPGIGESCHAESQRSLPPASGSFRHDRQSGSSFDHLADRIKTAQPPPNLQPSCGTLGLLVDKILQRAGRAKADIVVVQRLDKSQFALACQRMSTRHDHDEQVAREREGL